METNDPTVKLFEARLAATKLRARAAYQEIQAQAYRRQAGRLLDEGQAEICRGKAAEVEALAAENRARAARISVTGLLNRARAALIEAEARAAADRLGANQ